MQSPARRSRQLAFLTMDVLSEPGAASAASAGQPGRVVFLYSLVPGAHKAWSGACRLWPLHRRAAHRVCGIARRMVCHRCTSLCQPVCWSGPCRAQHNTMIVY